MLNNTPHRGFIQLHDEHIDELISPVSIMPILLTGEILHDIPVKVFALWDTGATVTCMKPALWNYLKPYPLDTASSAVLSGIGGSVSANSTLVHIFLADNLEIIYCQVYALDFPGDADLLIGMDIIGMGDFAVCNADNKTSFSFAIPSFPDRIDLADKADTINKQNKL
jgi:hypothetical protein